MADIIKGNTMNAWGYITTISIAALIILAVAVLAVALVPETVRAVVNVVLYGLVVGLALFMAISLVGGAATGIEHYRMSRATRRATENDAALTVIDAPAGNRVFTYEHGTGEYHNLTLDPRPVIKGNNGPAPTEIETRMWALYHQSLHDAAPRGVGSEPVMIPEPTQQPIDILAALQRTPRGLIVGASDAGKSTVLRWLSEQSSRQGNVVVIDPHSAPGKWPGECTVIGAGSRHDLIEQALDALVNLMIKRYKQIGHGEVEECGHPRVTVIVDEWMAIAEQCSNAKATLIRLLTESRKAAFAIYIGSVSERVRSLGLDGRGDLRQGFEIYHLAIDQRTGSRRAWLEIDGDETPLTLPGAYVPESSGRADDLQPLKALDVPPDTPLAPDLGSVEEQVIMMTQEGQSKKQISEAAWGAGKFGAFYNSKIENILRKYGARS